ncbi:MAG TPA: hypothetical protein PKA41_01305 [Verrucomicrobiota bacterium]|nr:hypothetical protein [Verrucomicrobiota bacterium]
MRHFWLILTLIYVFCAILRLPSLTFPHTETDEQIFWHLALKIRSSGEYNLQGTEILTRVSPHIYDRPLFLHPPLYAVTLTPFTAWGSLKSAVAVSWLGHFLCILAVALIGRQLCSMTQSQLPEILLWLPVLGVAMDPFLIFLSGRLWADSLLAGLCAMSMALFFCARQSKRRTLCLVAGGVLFGLAALTKLPALVLTPVAIWLIVKPETGRRAIIRDLCLGGVPALLLVLPWFVTFYRTFGVLIPDWTRPDEWTLAQYPFVRAAVERSPLYYLVKLAAIQPLCVLCLGAYLFNRDLWKSAVALFPVVWFLLFLVVLSVLGMRGQGFQMRFLGPMFPAVYLMLYMILVRMRNEQPVALLLVVFCVIYGGITGALIISEDNEIMSILEMGGALTVK